VKKRGYRALLGIGITVTLVAGLLLVVPFAGRSRASVAVDAAEKGEFPLSADGRVLPPAEGAYMGFFRDPAPFDIDSLDSYRWVSPKTPAVVMWFQPWTGNSAFDVEACNAVIDRGAIPLISWEPWNPGSDSNYVKDPGVQPKYQLRDINAGKYDGYIKEWARAVQKVNGPVMLRPMHEMNGTWYPWGGTVNGNTPAQFITAWKRIWRIFRDEGATNVTWVWSINWQSIPDNRANRFDVYYPGDAYVDWTSISGYNWGTSRASSTWKTFGEVYDKPIAFLETKNKPIMLSEFASVSSGGDKAGWIRDSYARVKEIDRVKAILYYDKREVGLKGEQDWEICSSWLAWRAYRRAMDDPYFKSGLAGTLPESDLGAPSTP